MATDLPDLLDDKQVAALLKVHREVLGRWRRDGSGPPYMRLGPRKVMYSGEGVRAWLDSRTFASRAAEVVR